MRIVLILGFWVGQCLMPVWAEGAPTLAWKLVDSHPHDASSFTQGLVIDGDQLIEGTGLYGHSRLTVRDWKSGRLLHSASLPNDHFGEGVAVVGDRIIQLTWKNGIGHVFDRQLQPVARFRLSGEGWGLTSDGTRLVRSDGSSRLRFHDLQTYAETGQIEVVDGGLRVENLNELEFVDGDIYANVWQTNRIAVIDPTTGKVRAWIDLTGLSDRFPKPAAWNSIDAVLNGIAVVPASKHLLVTGKLWPRMFELSVDRRPLRPRQSSERPTAP